MVICNTIQRYYSSPIIGWSLNGYKMISKSFDVLIHGNGSTASSSIPSNSVYFSFKNGAEYSSDHSTSDGHHQTHCPSNKDFSNIRFFNKGIHGGSLLSSQPFRIPMLSSWQQCRLFSTFTFDQSEDGSPKEPDFSDIRRPSTEAKKNGDPRLFTYAMIGSAGVFTAMGAKSTVLDFLTLLSASGDTMALAQTEVDLSAIPEGKNVVIKWRGKPVFIRHRTAAEIEESQNTPLHELRDPQLDSDRVKKPEWLVMLGVCTHLGCVPTGDSGDYNGWYCPCHGSHYDISGRIRRGPAPLNLEIPQYTFTDELKIVIG